MEFCPECGSMLLPTEDNELKCSCGYTKKLSKDKSEYNVNEKIKKNDSVIEKGEDVNTLPTTKSGLSRMWSHRSFMVVTTNP